MHFITLDTIVNFVVTYIFTFFTMVTIATFVAMDALFISFVMVTIVQYWRSIGTGAKPGTKRTFGWHRWLGRNVICCITAAAVCREG